MMTIIDGFNHYNDDENDKGKDEVSHHHRDHAVAGECYLCADLHNEHPVLPQ